MQIEHTGFFDRLGQRVAQRNEGIRDVPALFQHRELVAAGGHEVVGHDLVGRGRVQQTTVGQTDFHQLAAIWPARVDRQLQAGKLHGACFAVDAVVQRLQDLFAGQVHRHQGVVKRHDLIQVPHRDRAGRNAGPQSAAVLQRDIGRRPLP